MLRPLRSALVAVTLLGVLPAAAGAVEPASTEAAAPSAADAKALIAKVEARYKDVTSLKGKFTQIARSEVFGDEKTTGEVSLKRPNKMRWSYGSEKEFITNGKKMWAYNAEDKQVIEYDDIAAGQSSADSLLTSLDKISDLFDIQVLASSDAGHDLVLTPKDAATAQFKRVELSLDGELQPRKVVITSTFDEVTELTFASIELNAKIDDSVFEFSAPAGVDVVKASTN